MLYSENLVSNYEKLGKVQLVKAMKNFFARDFYFLNSPNIKKTIKEEVGKKIALSWKLYRGELKKIFQVSYLSNVRHTAEIQSPSSQWRPDLVSVCVSLASECLSSRNVLIFKVPVGKRSIAAAFYRRDAGAENTVSPGSRTLPVMEKHQSFLPLIPHHHYPSLCSSRSIHATINQILKWRGSCIKN